MYVNVMSGCTETQNAEPSLRSGMTGMTAFRKMEAIVLAGKKEKL
jgi:hypothetical protein